MKQLLRISAAVSVALTAIIAFNAGVHGDTPTDQTKKTERLTSKQRMEKRRLARISKSATPESGFESVEMFAAMESGDVEVIIKAKSAADSNVLVKNNSDKPLAIEMPATFSAVPVLRQAGFGGGGGRGGGGLGGGGFGGGGGQQGIGGGFGGGGLGGGGFGGGGRGGGGLGGGGGGVFNIPPGKVGKVAVKTVCLEHGKKDPKSHIEYVIQPLEKLNSDPKVRQMIRMLAEDEISQNTAQAASWHVTDELSWQELAVKNRIESQMGGYSERYFNQNELLVAQQAVAVATERVKQLAEAEKAAGQTETEDYYTE